MTKERELSRNPVPMIINRVKLLGELNCVHVYKMGDIGFVLVERGYY